MHQALRQSGVIVKVIPVLCAAGKKIRLCRLCRGVTEETIAMVRLAGNIFGGLKDWIFADCIAPQLVAAPL